jgi:hypothetical protein
MIAFRYGKRPFQVPPSTTSIADFYKGFTTTTAASPAAPAAPSAASTGVKQLLVKRPNTHLIVESKTDALRGRLQLSAAEIKAINSGSTL